MEAADAKFTTGANNLPDHGLSFAISIHEYAHGAMANSLGDPTARYMGRLSLNPLRHLDLFGVLTLILSGFRFGWAKPVPINPSHFKNPKRG